MSNAGRDGARKLINSYFKQLTEGCGNKDCSNIYCANGGKQLDRTAAATLALALARKGSSNICTESLEFKSTSLNDIALTSGSACISQLLNTCSLSISRDVSCSQQTKYGKFGPEASPIYDLDSALNWIPGCDDLCVPSIHRVSSFQPQYNKKSPKMLICHDMMGGYQKDRFVQGHSELEDFYFYHWNNVEAFIYFSHHFLTIPPPCWTNAAHTNGRLSMGTMITEWKDGAKLCAQLLSSEAVAIKLAQQMVMIAQYYRFDGWLVNIENHVNSSHVDNLFIFLSLLTGGMHEVSPHSKVIWYDSITIDGYLKWQNALNKMNQPFFDVCDGIFLNYNWTLPLLQASATLAAHRRTDVYVGVDVFGRQCYGGGGYNTGKALEVIKQASLSTAVFAPGWVYETQPKAIFFKNQDRFWSLLEIFCPEGDPHTLPIVSSFSRGCGDMVNIDGTLVYKGQWSNLSAQDLQPGFSSNMIRNSLKGPVYLERCEVDNNIAYYSGSSLKLTGRVVKAETNYPSSIRLFRTAIDSVPLVISYTFSRSASVTQFLQLQCRECVIFLDPSSYSTGEDVESGLPTSGELSLPDGWPSTTICLLGALPSPHWENLHTLFTGDICQAKEWKTRYFIVPKMYLKSSVHSVGVALCSFQTMESKFQLNIGELKLLRMECISLEKPKIEKIYITDLALAPDNTVSLTLNWCVNESPMDPITHSNIFITCLLGSTWRGGLVYLGPAFADCYRLSGIHILSTNLVKETFGIELRIQIVTASRKKTKIHDSPATTVWLKL